MRDFGNTKPEFDSRRPEKEFKRECLSIHWRRRRRDPSSPPVDGSQQPENYIGVVVETVSVDVEIDSSVDVD